MSRLVLLAAALCLQGCVVTSTAGLVGDVAVGTVKTGAFVGKTAVRTTGAVAEGVADGLTHDPDAPSKDDEER